MSDLQPLAFVNQIQISCQALSDIEMLTSIGISFSIISLVNNGLIGCLTGKYEALFTCWHFFKMAASENGFHVLYLINKNRALQRLGLG